MSSPNKKQDLSTLSCTSLHGVGNRVAEKLQKLDIYTVQDLLFHLPFRYQDRTRISPLNQLNIGDYAVVEGEVKEIILPKGGRTGLLCRVIGTAGFILLRFFHVNSFLRQQLSVGARIRCFGEVRYGTYGFEMVHPEYQLINPLFPLPSEKTLTPIYSTTEGLSQLMFRKLTDRALEFLEQHDIQEMLPEELLKQYSFPTLKEVLLFIHRPPVKTSVDVLLEGKHPYQKRLVFEELLAHRLSLLRVKKNAQAFKATPLVKINKLSSSLLSALPFSLTSAQQRVIAEIQLDLEKSFPMLRLVQGDVGSGKTLVAAVAILQAVENNYQSAVLAPTDILAEQHYRNFQQWLSPLGITVVLLSGQLKVAERRIALAAIQEGRAQVIIGTHAIFQKEVTFPRLALLVIDEQHRFGVQQRALLREKGIYGDCHPHQLIMTATPIPRTLTMSVYADLDCSVIDELPPGRKPVTTSVISNKRREEVLLRIREGCHQGRQAYWVCTLIEESEMLQCQAAQEALRELSLMLPDLKIGLIHGRMKSQEKETVMADFKKGDTHLLIATTIIEVGVDVPNASLMIIENAERLGLAQLHQLRGRVGRGVAESHCVLMYQAPLSLLAKQRLAVMRETNDGFKVAQRDLELRGPGEVLGTKQTGDISLRVADLLRDSDLLPTIQQAAHVILEQYAERIPLLIKRWLGKNEQYGHV
jgi:ATP-dependent DNA helicase RecG